MARTPALAWLYRNGHLVAEATTADDIRGHAIDDIAWLREPTTEEYAVALAGMAGAAQRDSMHTFSSLRKGGMIRSAKQRTPLSFEEWHNLYGDEISIKAAELGCDRERGFNVEDFEEDEYFHYVSQTHDSVLRPSSSVLCAFWDLWFSTRRTWERHAWQLLFTPGPWYVASACPIRDMHQTAYKAVHRQGAVPAMVFSHTRAGSALKQAVKFAQLANWSKEVGTAFTHSGPVNTYHLFPDGREDWHATSTTCLCEINNLLEGIEDR